MPCYTNEDSYNSYILREKIYNEEKSKIYGVHPIDVPKYEGLLKSNSMKTEFLCKLCRNMTKNELRSLKTQDDKYSLWGWYTWHLQQDADNEKSSEEERKWARDKLIEIGG